MSQVLRSMPLPLPNHNLIDHRLDVVQLGAPAVPALSLLLLRTQP